MNPAFDEVLAAGSAAMLSAFDTTAQRLGTASENIEKGVWSVMRRYVESMASDAA